jgi:hypothetical protein
MIEQYNYVMVPAGTYVLGDPCYSFRNHDNWLKIINSSDHFNNPIADIDGVKILAFSTQYGDGHYIGSDDFIYLVDAGLIGLVPIAIVEDLEYIKGICNIVTFVKETKCFELYGVLHFGDISIDTGDIEEILIDEC